MGDPPSKSETEDWEALYAALSEHSEVIGRVTVSWNMCQLLVFSLFYMMSGMSWERSRAVFFALKADVQQREITMALAAELPRRKGSPRKKITSAIGRLNELATERNAAIHTMWQVSPEQGRLVPAADIAHNPKLDLESPLAQFRDLERKLDRAHSALLKATLAMAVFGPVGTSAK